MIYTHRRLLPAILFATFTLASAALAQRGSSDWSTTGGDAQRSSWVRSDPKISVASLGGKNFQFLYKLKLGDEPLSAPALLNFYIGYRGFRAFAFIGGSADDAFAVDTDLGRLEWRKHLASDTQSGSGNCPGGMTASLTRPVSADIPSGGPTRFGGGRGIPAKSGVGEPMEGAITLVNRPSSPPMAPPPASTSRTGPAPHPQPSPFAPHPTLVYAAASDGTLHSLYVSNGEESQDIIPFLPAHADAAGFSVVDGIVYAVTENHCNGAPDGLWALDLATKNVSKWGGSVVGGANTFSPEATYVASDSKLMALDAKTLTAGSSYDAGQSFVTAPVLFEYSQKTLLAAATKDGTIHVVDSTAMGSALAKSTAQESAPFALTTWQTAAETRWIIATSDKGITAWKLNNKNGAFALEQGWAIRDLASPATPLVINGVLFVLERGERIHHAELRAYDASTGKQLWTSGSTVTSRVSKIGGLAAGGSSVYFGTDDGTLWAFGFPIEH